MEKVESRALNNRKEKSRKQKSRKNRKVKQVEKLKSRTVKS